MYWNNITLVEAKVKVPEELIHGKAEVITEHTHFTLEQVTETEGLVLSCTAITVHGLNLDQALGYILGYHDSKVLGG